MGSKRFFSAVLCCLLLLTATGCRSRAGTAGSVSTAPLNTSAATASTPSAAGHTEQPVRVGLSMGRYADNTLFYDSLSTALSAAGYDLISNDCHGDQAEQNRLVGEQLRQGCSLLIVEPVMVSAMEAVVSQAKDAHVPLLILGYEPSKTLLDAYDKLSYVGMDPAAAGAAQARMLASLPQNGDLNGDGTVSYLMLSGPEADLDAQLRRDSANLTLEAAGACELLNTAYCDWTADSGAAQCARQLSAYGPDIEVILCGSDRIALGAAQAVTDGGWIPGQDICILGIGADSALLEKIAAGTVSGTVLIRDTEQILRILEFSELLLAGQGAPKVTRIPWSPVTADSTAQYLPQ